MRKLLALRSLPQKPFGVAGALVALFLLGACATEEGVTPTCVQVVQNPETETPCHKYARCDIDPNNPETCCKDVPEGERDLCLYGYGVFGSPDGSGGAGGSGGQGGSDGSGGQGGAGGGS